MDSRINPPQYSYHYTGSAEARDVLREGVIRASPATLYADLAMSRVLRRTAPVVWLTINPMIEMTVWVKLAIADGRFDFLDYLPEMPRGRLWRFAVPYGIEGDLSIPEYCDKFKIPYDEWKWNVHTAQLVGADWTCSRIVPRDVPRAEWLMVESLDGIGEEGFRWETVPF